ncbi:hypothetical protein V8C44DRAFT_143991 [Trichoderma aethiopicum]
MFQGFQTTTHWAKRPAVLAGLLMARLCLALTVNQGLTPRPGMLCAVYQQQNGERTRVTSPPCLGQGRGHARAFQIGKAKWSKPRNPDRAQGMPGDDSSGLSVSKKLFPGISPSCDRLRIASYRQREPSRADAKKSPSRRPSPSALFWGECGECWNRP